MDARTASALLSYLLFFSSTIVPAVAQTGFVSIDCGATEAYEDADNGIEWVSDVPYISSGVNSEVANQSVSQSLRTLRYFPNSNSSNCYVLPVTIGNQYFFRATFYYGDYDSQQSWPSFYLSFDENNWSYQLIGTDYALDEAASVELIFTANQGTSINLCLNSNDWINDVPFISSLELRPLSDFYSDDTEFAGSYLHLRRRNYFSGDINAIIRYPQDNYDRKWYPLSYVPPFANRISSNQTVDNRFTNEPPNQVLMTALEGKNNSLFNYTVDLGRVNSRLLFYFYFWELRSDRKASDIREFNMFISSNNGYKSESLTMTIAPNDTWTAIFWGRYGSLADTVLAFTMIPTSNSTFPPMLNAFEIFAYSEPAALASPSPPNNSSPPDNSSPPAPRSPRPLSSPPRPRPRPPRPPRSSVPIGCPSC